MAFLPPPPRREVPKSVSSNCCIAPSLAKLCQQVSPSARRCARAASQAGRLPSTPGALVGPLNPSSLCKGVRNFSEAFALHVTQASFSTFLPVTISLHQKAKRASLERRLRSGGRIGWLWDARVVSQSIRRAVGQNTRYLAHFWGHVLLHDCSPLPAEGSAGLCPHPFARVGSRDCACLPGRWQAGLHLLPLSPGGSSARWGLQRFQV